MPNNDDYIETSKNKILLWNGFYKIDTDIFEGNHYKRSDPNLYHKSILEETKCEEIMGTMATQISDNIPDEKDMDEMVFGT